MTDKPKRGYNRHPARRRINAVISLDSLGKLDKLVERFGTKAAVLDAAIQAFWVAQLAEWQRAEVDGGPSVLGGPPSGE